MCRLRTIGAAANPDQEVLYGATNPPDTWEDLSAQLTNYYAQSKVSKLESLYGIAETSAEGSNVDPRALNKLYGQIVADGQVYVPSRTMVQALFEGGIDMSRILRYRLSWRPAGTSRIALYSDVVTHSDDTWACEYPNWLQFCG
jgi:hypothetical protein